MKELNTGKLIHKVVLVICTQITSTRLNSMDVDVLNEQINFLLQIKYLMRPFPSKNLPKAN